MIAAVMADPAVFDSPTEFAAAVPDTFLLQHGISAADVAAELRPIRDGLTALSQKQHDLQRPALISIDEIDTFARVKEVPATGVQHLCPLDLLEDVVEQIIVKVIGEPFTQKDWGGELDDLFTHNVYLDGRAVRTSMLLKGRGLSTVMKMKNLGKNGDQVTRMVKQPADLFIVQHVNRIDASVVAHLRDSVMARRAEGYGAVGSIWDGVAVARLGVAYGYLDATTGQLLSGDSSTS
ncbi:MAG: hypothetical protein ABIP57_05900 [Jatrophihabitantaceae bacterium]